jgi:hypothetical protein
MYKTTSTTKEIFMRLKEGEGFTELELPPIGLALKVSWSIQTRAI